MFQATTCTPTGLVPRERSIWSSPRIEVRTRAFGFEHSNQGTGRTTWELMLYDQKMSKRPLQNPKPSLKITLWRDRKRELLRCGKCILRCLTYQKLYLIHRDRSLSQRSRLAGSPHIMRLKQQTVNPQKCPSKVLTLLSTKKRTG